MSTSKTGSGGAKLSDVNLTDPGYVDKEKEDLIEENRRLKEKARQNMVLALVLGIIALVALGVLVGLAVNRSIDDDTPANLGQKGPLVCGSTPEGFTRSKDRLDEPTHPGLFHGLTTAEIRRVRAFLEMDIGVVKPDVATLGDPHIYIMDLQPPIKSEALAHLDHGDVQPDRQARVTVFRGDKTPPIVEEMVCGPLHNISACTVDLTVPFAHRPIEYREYITWDRTIIREIQHLFGQILRESYGGSFDYDMCEGDCLNYWSSPVGSNVYGDLNTRKVWLRPTYNLDFMSLHPLDFAVLCNVDGINETLFSIEKVWYAGQMFENAAQLLNEYAAGSINKTQTTYPTEEEIKWASLQQQEPPKPVQPLRPPLLIEPDGKRFTVTHGKVEYLDMWSFHYHMSTIHGPALYDIRFQGERIVYELSLMELVAVYSADNPATRLTFYADSSAVTGSQSKALIVNADCPSTATFLPFIVSSQTKEEPDIFSKGICIFEQNTGRPLRRHHSYSTDDGSFYGGMMDSVLIVRSIHTVDNYDYVMDFKFHQDGAVHVSMSSTGYLLASVYSSAEQPYGNRLRENLFGPLHLHAGHFKVDMDINGTSNRYETLNIVSEEVDLRQTSPVRKFFQTKFSHDLKSREMDAVYSYEFDKPMYHIFHNDEARNMYGERKSYRLVNNAMAKQLIPRDEGNEKSFTWTRYQMSVTERKDTERVSSTPDVQWNSFDPVVNFQTYIDDDDDIVDKDLVAWVTLGSHHIPHTEDLPVTPTTGTELSFFLQPYNYFHVNPSVTSRDAVYIDHVDDDNPSLGLTFDYLGTGDVTMGETSGKCEFRPINMSAPWARAPNELFD